MGKPGPPVMRRRILVVEDHDDTREMVQMFLECDGYDVTPAADGMQALEQMTRLRPCLILLDVMMPVMDGPTFARRLRQSDNPKVARTPIVLVTAVPDAREIQADIGALDVIPKPFCFDAVTTLVERHCPKDGDCA